MQIVGKNKRDCQQDKKSAHWKVLIALFMKDHTSVANSWLARHLHMGAPQGVSRYTAKLSGWDNELREPKRTFIVPAKCMAAARHEKTRAYRYAKIQEPLLPH